MLSRSKYSRTLCNAIFRMLINSWSSGMLISLTQAANVSLIFYECIVTYAIGFILLEIMYNSYVRRITIWHMIITTYILEH